MKSQSLLFTLIFQCFSCFGYTVLKPDPYPASGNIARWRDELKMGSEERIREDQEPETGSTECIEMAEIPNAFLCLSYLQETMNRIFYRASLFAEGGKDRNRGAILPLSSNDYAKGLVLAKGHDLTFADLRAFFSLNEPLNVHEMEFRDQIWNKLAERSEGVILGFSIQNVASYEDAVSHEALHAQFFLNDRLREAVTDFYTKALSVAHRTVAERELGRFYNTNDIPVMANEVFAYLLQRNANRWHLRELVQPCARQLLDYLETRELNVQIIY